MTFADIALGMEAVADLGEQRFNTVTASLTTQFVSVARIDEFIYCKAEVLRQSQQLIFVRGLICVDNRTVASVDGIYKCLAPRSAATQRG